MTAVNHLETENAWYLAELVPNTNMYMVLKRQVAAENYSDVDCFCVRGGDGDGGDDSNDDGIPPRCRFQVARQFDRYRFELVDDDGRSFLDSHRCECPCFLRDLNFQACDNRFIT